MAPAKLEQPLTSHCSALPPCPSLAQACFSRVPFFTALGSTVIGRGTKFNDNISIGHGTIIGEHCLIVSQVGIAGSVTVGHHVTMAGQVGVAGHLTIGDNVTVAAQSGIFSDVPDQSVVLGSPAMPLMHARRTYAIFRNLPELQDRVKKLEGLVEELGTQPGAGLDGGDRE